MDLSGAKVTAGTLKRLGVKTVFGVVGIPVVEIAEHIIANGIRFIPFRNEQQASYAASIYGYLTNEPGVLLVVGGPGVINALAGVYNANTNKWPLVVIAGSCGINEVKKAGGFQEMDQVSLMKSNNWSKFAAQPNAVANIPGLLQKAYILTSTGKPGTTYIDLRADIIQSEVSSTTEEMLLGIDKFGSGDMTLTPDHSKVKTVASLIENAKFPLLIVGKGSAPASNTLRQFVDEHKMAFLPTPMGKGVIPDTSKLNISSGRSQALKSADVVILAGARLNWILHLGETHRFHKNVKFVQIDCDEEELAADSRCVEYGLHGDIGCTIHLLGRYLTSSFQAPEIPDEVVKSIAKNEKKQKQSELITDQGSKNVTHAQALGIIRNSLSEQQLHNTLFISEGARTMDTSRLTFQLTYPKQRLDAGTNGTMGIGLSYTIAAKLANPEKLVVAIEGDSAFGFSAMEVETLVRCQLPVLIVILNNSGIYKGIVDPSEYVGGGGVKELPCTALGYHVRYDLLAVAMGGVGYVASTGKELEDVMGKALVDVIENKKVVVVNMFIQNVANEKLSFGWMSSKPKL